MHGQPLRYDNDGRQATVTTPAGRTVTTTWDTASRITKQVATATGRTATTRTYTYDNANRMLTGASSGDGTATSLTYTYNSRGLLATSKDATGTATVSWDLAHRLSSVAGVSGRTTTYGYDTTGQVATVRGTINANLTWRPDGQILTSTPVSPSTGAANTWTYDGAGRLSGQVAAGVNYGYTYTGDSLLATETSAGTTRTYTYDAASRLTKAVATGTTPSTQTYVWDTDSNRTSVTRGTTTTASTFDLADHLTSGGATSDADGLLTKDGVTTYAYNGFSELVSTTATAGSVTLARDAQGRLAGRTSGTTTVSLGYVGPSAVTPGSYSSTASGAVDVVSVPGEGVAGYASASVTQRVATNQHTDVTAVSTDTTGATVGSWTYDPFGMVSTSTGTSLVGLGYQSATPTRSRSW